MQLRKSVLFYKLAALTSVVVIIITSWFLYFELARSHQLSAYFTQLQSKLQKVTDFEELLLLEPSVTHKNTFAQLKFDYQNTFNELLAFHQSGGADATSLASLDEKAQAYFTTMKKLIHIQSVMGFDETSGIYGNFRRNAHLLQQRVENSALAELEVAILELRRREKDYFLRGEIRYLTMHDELNNEARKVIKALKLENDYLNLLGSYKQGFDSYVELLQVLGMAQGSGVKAQLFFEKRQLRSEFDSVSLQLQSASQGRKELIILSGLIIIVLVSGIVLMLLSYQNGKVSEHVLAINRVLIKVAKMEDFSLRVNLRGSDEIAQIGHHLDNLLAFIETLLQRLSAAQQKLIDEAKMASLGNMVSGFAQELNMPIDEAMVGQTKLKKQVMTLKEQLGMGRMQKQALATLISDAESALYLLESNLQRTASLVDDFQLVAGNQEFEARTWFNLKHLVETTFGCYHTELPSDAFQVELEIPEHLRLNSYPSAFNQILSYCIHNCIKHARVKGKVLNIVVSAMVINDYVHLYFKDDGAGIDKSLLPSIFEPFVTSKRFAGGTGLGLSIVYNLVKQRLAGEVKMQSPAHGGACLHIILSDTPYDVSEANTKLQMDRE
ncbi:ATP-binding protein [Pseudoalteromonas sp. T1lg65]|uniref:sensor histidine kinase n=1 Tax=Pseudoalteromonas sp. T1lg65 TaxID=2077101 RepID=UPI003F7AE5E9